MNQNVEQIKDWLGTGSINIFGWPFSGKDTQGRKLADLFDASLIGGGDILRAGKEIPQHVKDAINKGLLAPTEEFMQIVTPYLSKPKYAGKPLVLSSVGRWHGEEEGIIKACKASKHPIKAVVYLVLDKEHALSRAHATHHSGSADRGPREDDHILFFDTRFEEFVNKTLPVIDYYRDLELLVEIDALGTPDQVNQRILESLLKLSNK